MVKRNMSLILVCLVMSLVPSVLSAQSLWKAETIAEGTLYNDQVARQVGDLVTIRVVETTSVSDDRQTETTRESNVNTGITMLPGSNSVAQTPGGPSSNILPGLRYDSSKEFSGEGKYQSTGRVSATITGRVIDVLDNGNLLVEGRRAVTYNEETKVILITGICRTADLQTDNSVLSEKMHNFQVAIEGEGPLSRSQQEGWLSRLLDALWPL